MIVLSDYNAQIKIPIPARASDDDKVLVVFRKLAGSDDEEPLGKRCDNDKVYR